MILVTLGTQDKNFSRLLDAVQKQIDDGNIKEEVIVQAGCTKYESKDMKIFDLLDQEEFKKLISKCDLLITHGGVGSILTGLKNNKKVIAAARLSKYKEHMNDHQLQIIEKFTKSGYILELKDFDKLDEVIEKSKKFKPKKYQSNTDNMIKLISNFIDNDNDKKNKSIIKKIIILLITLIFISFISLQIYFNFVQEDKVVILTYHDVVDVIEDDPKTTVNISLDKFESQIKWLSKHNYKSLSMDDFYEWKVNNKKIPRKSVLITFDDGWKSFYTKAIPILEKYNMKASVFIIWKYSENQTIRNEDIYMNLNEIKDVNENHSDMEILSHSYNLHTKELADSKNYDLYNNDMKKVNIIQSNIKYYAYPFGKRNEKYIQALKDNKFKLAFTFGPYNFVTKENNNYEIPRLGLFESTPDWKFKLKMFLEI